MEHEKHFALLGVKKKSDHAQLDKLSDRKSNGQFHILPTNIHHTTDLSNQ